MCVNEKVFSIRLGIIITTFINDNKHVIDEAIILSQFSELFA